MIKSVGSFLFKPVLVHLFQKLRGDGISGICSYNRIYSAVGTNRGSGFIFDPFGNFFRVKNFQAIKAAAFYVFFKFLFMIDAKLVGLNVIHQSLSPFSLLFSILLSPGGMAFAIRTGCSSFQERGSAACSSSLGRLRQLSA